MKPKAVVISARIDWGTNQVFDVMWQFIDFGSNPIMSAHDFIESIKCDFPGHTHIVRSNEAAQEINRREVLCGLGVSE